MTLDELRHDVEREALFFAVLRERTHAADLPEDTERRLQAADAEICEWLDEAEEEGASILERARAEAARLQAETAAAVRSLHGEVRALQERLVELVEHAGALLPALEAADRSLDASGRSLDLAPPPVPALPVGEASPAAETPSVLVVDAVPRRPLLARLLRRG